MSIILLNKKNTTIKYFEFILFYMLESCSNILECEEVLFSNLQKIGLISDISLTSEDTNKLQSFISRRSLIDINDCTEFLRRSAPTSLACYLVWNGILNYHEGDFWTSIEKNTGLSDPNWQAKWGSIFLRVLRSLKLPIFETKDTHRYVTNILIQGRIPNSCLYDYYDKVLLPLVTKEIISSDPNEISFLLRSWRDYENKRLEKEVLLRKLKNIKDGIREGGWVNSITDLWDELEELRLLKSKIESIDESKIIELIDLRYKIELEINKSIKQIEYFEANRSKYIQEMSIFSEEDSFIQRCSEIIEKGLKISLDLLAGKKEFTELQEKLDSIKSNIDETNDSRNKIELEIIKTNKCIEDLKANKGKYAKNLSILTEEDSFILKHVGTIEDGLKSFDELTAGKKEAAELQEKVVSINNSIEEAIDSRNRTKIEITKTNKCIEDLEANKRKCIQDLSILSEEDAFILKHSESIEDGLKISHDLIAGEKEAAELQKKLESIKNNIDKAIDSRNETELEIVKTNKSIEDLEASKRKCTQDINLFSEEDSFILKNSEIIEDGLKAFDELTTGKKEFAELQGKIRGIKINIDEAIDSRNETELEITKTNKCIVDLEAKKRECIRDLSILSEEDSFILKHSESIEDGLKISHDLIAGEKEAAELQEKIESIENNVDEITKELFDGVWNEPYIDIIRQIRYEELEEKIEEYQSLKKREIEDKKASKSLFLSFFSKLSDIVPFFKKKEKNPSLLICDEIKGLLNGLPLDNKLQQESIFVSVPLLKEIPKLYDDYSLVKGNIKKLDEVNQALEAKLRTFAKTIGIDSDEDVREIQVELKSLNDKIKTSQEHERLAQIASVEIGKINTQIDNELNYQTQLRKRLEDLEQKSIPRLNDDYSLIRGNINRLEGANQALEAKLKEIANSVGIDSDEDIREILVKLSSFNEKIKTSHEHERLAQIASIETEKTNAKIEDALNYRNQLKAKLLDLELKEIPTLYDDYFAFKKDINSVKGANTVLEAKFITIANSVEIDSNDVREIHTILRSLNDNIKTSQEHEKLERTATAEIEKINVKFQEELNYLNQLRTKLRDLELKNLPKLHYDHSLVKGHINRLEGANQVIEAELSTIADTVGIGSNDDIREILTKLISFNDMIKASQEHEKIAKIASNEIEKIDEEIKNELNYHNQLRTKLYDLETKEISPLYDDYNTLKEKINNLEGANHVLEAELSIIADSVGIDSNNDIREIQTKLISYSDKIKASQEHEKFALIASIQIEKINNRINDEHNYQAKLKAKLYCLDRDISQTEENSEIRRLNRDLDLKMKILRKSYPNLDELRIKIEKLKRQGSGKNIWLEKIKTLNEKKMKIEAQINYLDSTSLQVPTLKSFNNVDKPIQRYFLFCGKHSEDFLFQSIKMFRQSIEKGSVCNLTKINLPERIINSFEKWWEQHYQKSTEHKINSRLCGFHRYKSPVVYFDYSGEIRCKLPSQFLQLTDSSRKLCLSLLADNNEVYNVPLSLYRLNDSLLESEELDFEVKFPAENYEFRLIHDGKIIKLWEIHTGFKPTSPFIAFDYESKKLILNSEIQRAQVLIVLKSEYLINPADCLFEEGELYGEWSGYSYKGTDLTEVDLFIISFAGHEYSIQVMEKSPWNIGLCKENLLQGVYSGDSELYEGKPPSIKVSFTKEIEIDNWILSIYRKNESDLSYLQQNYLSELRDTLRIDHNNNLFEIPLEAEAYLGKEVAGEFVVRLKNNLHNYDKELIFSFIPYINIRFNELIYLPKDSGHKEIGLTIQLTESSSFKVNHPAKVVSQRDSSLDIITSISEKDITGILKYRSSHGQFTLPISIQIPRVTWSLKGLRDNKYNKEIYEILEIPDEVFYDTGGESLFLKISFPSLISGICTLKHQDSEQVLNSKIKGNIAIFNISRFIDTVKTTSSSIQRFSICVSDPGNKNILINNDSFFSIRKWTIQNIICKQKKEENKRVFFIKWDLNGSIEKICIVFWRLEDEVKLEQVTINGSRNSLFFEIDEKLTKPGRYLLHFTREDPWAQPVFPGENAPNSKEIYIDLEETSLLELGNKEFDAGNYIEAIEIYRKVPKSANIGLVWFQKLNNGLVYNQKYSDALKVLYNLLKNDKQFDDHNCFHVPGLLDRVLSRQKDPKNEDLVVILILLRLIGKSRKYENSLRKARLVMPKVIALIKRDEIQLTNELQQKIEYVDHEEIEYARTVIRSP